MQPDVTRGISGPGFSSGQMYSIENLFNIEVIFDSREFCDPLHPRD